MICHIFHKNTEFLDVLPLQASLITCLPRSIALDHHITSYRPVEANSVIQKKAKPIDLKIYDVRTAFDSLWLEQCCNDMYEVGIQDEKLAMIYESNRANKVAVQTPVGLSERVDLPDIICQGGSNGPIICSVQTGSIGSDQESRGRHLYKYLGIVEIPSLTMLDDCLDISECNTDSVIDNTFIVAKMEIKKLELNSEKCHKIHIGQCIGNLCPKLKTHVKELQ